MARAKRFGIDGARFDEGDSAGALGAGHWARLRALDGRAKRAVGARLRAGATPDAHYDVLIAGGGLSLLLAPLLARAGLRVAVLDRARVGSSHREWNASAGELEALVRAGLFTHAELQTLVLARYREGTCRWYGHGATALRGVLDCAVDATALLASVRGKAVHADVALHDGVQVGEVQPGAECVRVAVRASDAMRGAGPATGDDEHDVELSASVFVDARGVHSPYARADLACPTVGGVFSGLEMGDARDQYRADVGEILATTEDVEDGRQHLWEAFPGRDGEVTVYLFAYVEQKALGERPLANLYERFWRTLPRFKRGTPRLLRPTYGIIPGWSRLRAGARSPHRRVLLVGDAAARHSPLTYCGFGAMLRSLPVAYRAVQQVLRQPLGRPIEAVDDAPVHSATGVLATLMANPPAPAAALNAILATSFATLAAMGNERYAAMLQDRLPAAEVARFLWRVSRQHPSVWRHVIRTVGPPRALAWSSRLAWQTARAAVAPR